MARTTTTALLAALVLVATAAGEEKKAKADKPVGTWTRKSSNGTEVTFKIADDKMSVEVVTPNGGTITADVKYGVTDDGTLFGVITKVEKKGTDAGPEKGVLIGFQFKVTKDKLTLSNFRASVDNPQAKELVEGDYEKK
jgi:hypothetical protein